jgi:hypothetical protein
MLPRLLPSFGHYSGRGQLNATIGMLSASGDGGSQSSASKKKGDFDLDLAIKSFPLP